MSPSKASPSVREARAAYFRDNQFGEDGGYGDRWVHFQLGPVPLAIPNTKARVRAVGYHDLHHLVTGYSTNYIGEFEISAWEVGAGCKGYGAAWLINLSVMTAGLLLQPRRTGAAFLRGLASDTLYGQPLEPLLDGPLSALAELTGARNPPEKMTAANSCRLLLAGLLGLAAGLVPLAVGLLAAPLLALFGARAQKPGEPAHGAATRSAQGPAS